MNSKYCVLLLLLIIFSCSDVFDDEAIYGCTDKAACNYNESATDNWEGACEYPIGTCDCDNLPIDNFCDCLGNIDSDFDGICDNFDICVGPYSDQGYYCNDIDVLYDFIVTNLDLSEFNPDSITVDDIFLNYSILPSWLDSSGRLVYLSLANQNIYSVPESIGTLDSLETLFLTNNYISSLPGTICDLQSSCEIFIQNNKLCEDDYLDCIDHWGEQECDE